MEKEYFYYSKKQAEREIQVARTEYLEEYQQRRESFNTCIVNGVEIIYTEMHSKNTLNSTFDDMIFLGEGVINKVNGHKQSTAENIQINKELKQGEDSYNLFQMKNILNEKEKQETKKNKNKNTKPK